MYAALSLYNSPEKNNLPFSLVRATPRNATSSYFFSRLKKEDSSFVEIDVETQGGVVQCAVDLLEALVRQRMRYGFSGEDNRPLADSLVTFVKHANGSQELRNRELFNELSSDPDISLNTSFEINTEPITDISSRVTSTWMRVANAVLHDVNSVCMSGRSHHTLPKDLYNTWSMSKQGESFHSYDVTYTVLETHDSDEANHESIAQQALAPLAQDLDIMRSKFGEEIVNRDTSVRLTLIVEISDKENGRVGAHCSIAYIVYFDGVISESSDSDTPDNENKE